MNSNFLIFDKFSGWQGCAAEVARALPGAGERRRWACLGLAAVLLLAGCQASDDYPGRPIVLVCPWAAGGGTDLVARQMAALLERELGVPVNVVNATGGAGVTGHTRGALATPDGYTLTMITVELNMLHWRGMTSINRSDFRPVVMLNRDDAALFVRADSPHRSLADLERAARDRARVLKASGTAQGGIWHVALAGWLDHLGLPTDAVTWISINGAAPSLQELLSGGVDLVCCSLPEARTLLEAGEIRCLGVMAGRRASAFPDVPTFLELGSDWSIGGWRGLALPRDIPRDRFETLARAATRAASSDAFRRSMDASGFDVSILGPSEFAAALAVDDVKFRDILADEAFGSVRDDRFGPYVFPGVLGGALALVTLGLLVAGGFRLPEDAGPMTGAGLARIGLAVGWNVAFLAILDEVGFVLSGTLLMLLLLRVLGVRWLTAIIVSAAIAPLSFQVFAVGLRVPLPWGWLGW